MDARRRLRAALTTRSVTVGDRRLTVPRNYSEAMANWRPSWRTDLIRQHPGLLLDIGANRGQTLADWIAAGAGRYVGFEPLTEAAAYLQAVVESNGLDAVIVPTGLSDKPGLIPIYVHRGVGADDMATTLADLRPGRDLARRFIPAVRGDEAWDALGRPDVALVKIDVEGAELEVLTGLPDLLADQRPPVICEVAPADVNADLDAYAQRVAGLADLLAEYKYEARRIDQAPDGRLVGLSDPVDAFPVVRYGPTSPQESDYLLLPL